MEFMSLAQFTKQNFKPFLSATSKDVDLQKTVPSMRDDLPGPGAYNATMHGWGSEKRLLGSQSVFKSSSRVSQFDGKDSTAPDPGSYYVGNGDIETKCFPSFNPT